jgi:DNA-binding FrmR family transcriptional regulator
MDDKQRTETLNRLRSAAGHITGIISMVEQDRYCIDVIKQIQAVQGALERVTHLILDDHLRHCVTHALREDDPQARERVLNELMAVFKFNP